MNKSKLPLNQTKYLKPYVLFLVTVWTVIVGASLWWNIYYHVNQSIIEQGRAEALSAYNKDLVYRRWAAGHGGVYVPVTDETPPNPYLSHVDERDISTPSGRLLTLVNPAYMTRQVLELGRDQYELRGHITSFKPLRPENAPDPWEEEALNAFEKGETEVSSIEYIDGEAYLRLMRPLVTEQRCLKCHVEQGYAVGDIRGGLSVSTSIAPHTTRFQTAKNFFYLGHVIIWILGLAAIALGDRRIRDHAREREAKLLLNLLERLNCKSGGSELIHEILDYIQKTTGIEAVAIRLVEGDDYPYFSTSGFPSSFVEAEKYLCARDKDNKIIRDGKGYPILECMCGNILQGRFDPSLPFFTAGGSFWSNNTTKLLEETTEKERQAHTRNRCNSCGYESVALIPIRSALQSPPLGLLQLNDHKENKFSLDLIRFLEEIGSHLGRALVRIKAEEQQREKMKLQGIIEMAGAICHNINQPLQVCMTNCELLTTGLVKAGDEKFIGCIEGIEKSSNKIKELTLSFQKIVRYESMEYAGKTRIVDIDKAVLSQNKN
jgi:Protein of unknown function (DUF3365)